MLSLRVWSLCSATGEATIVRGLRTAMKSTWRLNNTLLNNEVITEEIKDEIKKYLETNDNENTTTQNLWDAAKQFSEGSL